MTAKAISESIPQLFNGVSQQPDHLRRQSQCTEQKNAVSSIVEGLQKRPPREYVAKLSSTGWTLPSIHFINRDVTEQYVAKITSASCQVWDLTGVEKTVAVPDGVGYITNSSPRTNFKGLTIADYTFIVNRAKTIAMDTATTSAEPNTGLLVIKLGVVSSIYSVTIESTNYTYTTGAAVNQVYLIAAGLVTAIGTGPGGNYTVTRQGHVVSITRNIPGTWNLQSQDPSAGTAMVSFKHQIQRFSDLPSTAPNGYIVQIIGDSSSNFDDYYVKFTTDDGSSFNHGYWTETVAPSIQYKLDAATMPWALIKQVDGTFNLQKLTWGERVAGDTSSVPDPSFVGNTVNDLFLHKNRLGILSDENVILSRSGSYFDFFPETVNTVLDTDPIDVAASHTKVSILKHAVPYSEELLLFADSTQFKLTGGEVLTAKTVSITATTEFDTSTSCPPVGSGQNVYFTAETGVHTNVYEYFVDSVNDSKDAENISAHIPTYIPDDVNHMIASTRYNMLVALSENQLNTLYIYKYFWTNTGSGPVKVQSSWSLWEFDAECVIWSASIIGTYLYMVVEYGDGVFLERINLSEQVDTDSRFKTLLDRRITEASCSSVTYNSGTNQTTFTLPYDIPIGATMKMVTRYYNGTPFREEGELINIVSSGTNTLVVAGDKTSYKLYIGVSYRFQYRLSQFYKTESTPSGGTISVTSGRTQVRALSLNYVNTSSFKVEITPNYRDTSIFNFTGRLLGSGNNLIGVVPIESGVYTVPVMSKNDQVVIDIISDNHLPCKFTGANWTGIFIPN